MLEKGEVAEATRLLRSVIDNISEGRDTSGMQDALTFLALRACGIPAHLELLRHMIARRGLRQRGFLIGHILDDALEQRRGQIALAGIRQHAQDH